MTTPESVDVRKIAAKAVEVAVDDMEITWHVPPWARQQIADAVLAAVTPVIRRQVAEEIGRAINAEVVAANWAKTFRNGLEHAAAIARSHSQHPEET